MKIISQEEASAHYRYVLVQGSKGAAVGLAVGVGGIWLASRRFPAFGQMPLPFKAFLLSGVTAGSAVTSADRASLAFERQKYGSGAMEPQKVLLPADSDWKHRALLWASNNRWKLIGGTWAGTMAGSWYLINKNKYMTTAQKGVQARMIAQGITVILLLVSASLASRPGGEDDRIEVVDPRDPKKTIRVEEKYPGENQWMAQIATTEDEMRAEGKIDSEGHLKKIDHETHAKKNNGKKHNE